MKRSSHQSSAALLVLLASACQTGLPTELIVDNTPPTIPEQRVPPLSGGTLLVTRDGATAVASDPDRDRVVIAAVDGSSVSELPLQPHDEPGRLVEGADGIVFVALRSGGAVIAVDVHDASIVWRQSVCDAPRGMAYDDENQRLLVACATGHLVTLDAFTLEETERWFLGPDLRDVIVRDGKIAVTYFRSATLVWIDGNGESLASVAPRPIEQGARPRSPRVAWRTSLASDGLIVMLHQLDRVDEIELETGVGDGEPAEDSPYGGSLVCDEQPVHAEVSVFGEGAVSYSVGPAATSRMHLAIDLAIAPSGETAVVIDPSSRQVRALPIHGSWGSRCDSGEVADDQVGVLTGTPIAVAFAGEHVVVQTREPATLQIYDDGIIPRTIALGGDPRPDTGFDLFHNTSEMKNSSGLACASCHPEGRDDGHVWVFSEEGERRTQSLAGTLDGTAPFHWGGNLPSLSALVKEVGTRRMGGVEQSLPRVAALESWLATLEPLRPALDPVVEPSQVEQGQALFESETVGCASCHSGPSLTNNRNESVGFGESLQVPSLIGIGMRAPFMHDGCAATLMDRFEPACGGDQHGDLTGLDEADLQALVAYMNTL